MSQSVIRYAHSAQDELGNLLPYEHWQTLQSHSVNVDEMAAEFARVFGAQEIAYQTGQLHDLGKYSEAPNRLRSEILDHTVEQAAQPHGLFTPPYQRAAAKPSLPLPWLSRWSTPNGKVCGA